MKKNIDIASIYNTYVDDLYSYAIYLGFDREVVMDAIHDVFFKLCGNEKNIETIQNLKFYLFRSLKNTLINIYKTTKNTVNLYDAENSNDESYDIEDKLIGEENTRLIKEKIDTMLKSLTKKQQEIIYLRYVQEYDYDQISELLHITPVACRKLVHKAMQRLRETHPLSIFLFLFI